MTADRPEGRRVGIAGGPRWWPWAVSGPYPALPPGHPASAADTSLGSAHRAITGHSAEALLVLCASALRHIGDRDQAMHLLRVALDRSAFSRMKPRPG